MDQVSLSELEADTAPGDVECRRLGVVLGMEHAAVNHYRVPPGEALPAGLHAHGDQEEVFLVLLAVGAPRDSEDIRIPASCPACGSEELRLETDGGVRLVCPGCAAEHVPADCPECGAGGMYMTLAEDGEPVAACRDCAATFAEPPTNPPNR